MKLHTNSTNGTNSRLHTALSGLAVTALVGMWLMRLFVSTAYAQESEEANFLDLARIDNSNPPMVNLWLYSDGQAGDLGSATVELNENDQPQALIGDGIEPAPIQLAVVIDPWQINANGVGGQPSFNHVASTLRTLVEKPAATPLLVRLQDQVAAYSLSPDNSLQVIQAWSNEPNLLYNSVVLTPIGDGASDDQLTSLLLQAIEQFAAAPAAGEQQPVKTILLFANGFSRLDLDTLLPQAKSQAVHIQVINLSGEGTPSPSLQQLAQATHGHYADFVPDGEPATIWTSLSAYHAQRHLVYVSEATGERQVVVSLKLGGQTTLTQSFSLPASAAAAATTASATTPKGQAGNRSLVPAATSTAQATSAEPASSANKESAASDVAAAPTVVAETDLLAAPTAAVATAQVVSNAAEQPANVAQAAPTALANRGNSQAVASPMPTIVTTYIPIPGLGFAVPRGLLLLALPVLLVLLFYLIYRESRDRNRRRPGEYQLATLKKADGKFNVSNELKLRAQKQAVHNHQNGQNEASVPLRPLVETRSKPAPKERPTPIRPEAENNPPPSAPRRPFDNGNRPIERPAPVTQETIEDEDDVATFASLNFTDDEATFRLRENVEQPIIGKLVRVSNNPHLPQQLPIYGLNPGAGQSRQIHIGRHSKNNTVVINDKAVSREHAVLIQREGRLYLRDNGSSAGTFLNWRRLQPGEELLLRHNDLIGFGEISYEFHAKGEDEATIANP